jgi:hypothetical protein
MDVGACIDAKKSRSQSIPNVCQHFFDYNITRISLYRFADLQFWFATTLCDFVKGGKNDMISVQANEKLMQVFLGT